MLAADPEDGRGRNDRPRTFLQQSSFKPTFEKELVEKYP